jgi:hypothetical protein
MGTSMPVFPKGRNGMADGPEAATVSARAQARFNPEAPAAAPIPTPHALIKNFRRFLSGSLFLRIAFLQANLQAESGSSAIVIFTLRWPRVLIPGPPGLTVPNLIDFQG